MTEQSATSTLKWPFLKKFLFLFILIYTFFYFFPFPFDEIPHSEFITDFYFKLPDSIVLWVGNNIFHIHGIKIIPTADSGDTTFDYASVLTFSILSVLLSILISVIDRKRNNYEKLYSFLMIYIRYCVAFYMFIYGLDKVFKSHFPALSLARLEQTYGNSSPQGLLWACLGYSTSYTVFIGLMEVLSGALLFFRKTQVFGTLVILVIMINVLVVNLSYDVPVKLFAIHLILFSLILLYPNLRSVFTFFFSGKNAALTNYNLQLNSNRLNQIRKILKPVVIIGFFLLFVRNSINNMNIFGDAVPIPPLYGIYKAEIFILNNDTIPMLANDSLRWNEMIIDKKATIVKTMNNSSKYYYTKTDTLKKTIDLKWYGDKTQQYHLTYEINNNYFIVKGNKDKDLIYVRFKKTDLNNFLLVNRGFHWVNDYPLNR